MLCCGRIGQGTTNLAACVAAIGWCALAGTKPAQANYDLTKWRMTQQEVKTLYPTGQTLSPYQYSMRKTIGGIWCVVDFIFWSQLLDGVYIFPEHEGEGYADEPTRTVIPRGEGQKLADRMFALLSAKYGKPVQSRRSCGPFERCQSVWRSRGGRPRDVITLQWDSTGDGGFAEFKIEYLPAASSRACLQTQDS